MQIDIAQIQFDISRRTAQLGFELIDDYARRRHTKQGDAESLQRAPSPGPIGPVRFQVSAREEDGAVQRLAKPLTMEMRRTPSGVFGFSGLVTQADDDRKLRLPAGRYEVRISSQNYQTMITPKFDFPATNPRQALQQYSLKPGYAYPFAKGGSTRGRDRPTLLRGNLHHSDGQPVDGAIVNAKIPIPIAVDRRAAGGNWEDEYLTDEAGQWVLVVPDNVFSDGGLPNATIHITYPDGATVPENMPELLQWKDNPLSETVLRGNVVNGERIGIPRAMVGVRHRSGQTTTDNNGDWTYYFRAGPVIAPTVQVTAEVAGQPPQTQNAHPIVHEEVTVPSFTFN
jgi:hypothetical protein